MLSPEWMGQANTLGASLPRSCHLNIYGEEEGFKKQGLRFWGEVLSEGAQMGSQEAWAASAKGTDQSDPSQGIQ